MKKDVNRILLFLTIIPIFLYIIFSIHYQNRLNEISFEYNEKLKKFEEATGNAILEQKNKTYVITETALKDKEALEVIYSGLKVENQNLANEKERLENELNSLESQLNDRNTKFDLLQAQFRQVQNSLIKSNEEISGLMAKNRQLCGSVKASGGEC